MRLSSRRFTAALLTAALFATSAAALAQALTPPPGPHAVGLRIVQQFDVSRGATPVVSMSGDSTVREDARPMHTLVWYPAKASSAPHVRLLDYLHTGQVIADATPANAAQGP